MSVLILYMLAKSHFYPPKSACTRKEYFMQRPFCRDQRSQNSNVMCTLLFIALWPSMFRIYVSNYNYGVFVLVIPWLGWMLWVYKPQHLD